MLIKIKKNTAGTFNVSFAKMTADQRLALENAIYNHKNNSPTAEGLYLLLTSAEVETE